MMWQLPPLSALPESDACSELQGRLQQRSVVSLGDVVHGARAPLTAALGKAQDGSTVTLDIASLPHLAIAGASGSGKSTLIHTMLTSLLMAATPDDLRIVAIDMTGELDDYEGLPHLLVPPIDQPDRAISALEILGGEVENRYGLLKEAHARDIDEYNASTESHLPRVLCVVDEFADMMLNGEKKRIEQAVSRIGIKGRKCGIHLVLATQIPHAMVLTAPIKANMTGRIALGMVNSVHSRVAIDVSGAERLQGKGDALLRANTMGLIHFQAAFVPHDVTRHIVSYWQAQAEPIAA